MTSSRLTLGSSIFRGCFHSVWNIQNKNKILVWSTSVPKISIILFHPRVPQEGLQLAHVDILEYHKDRIFFGAASEQADYIDVWFEGFQHLKLREQIVAFRFAGVFFQGLDGRYADSLPALYVNCFTAPHLAKGTLAEDVEHFQSMSREFPAILWTTVRARVVRTGR